MNRGNGRGVRAIKRKTLVVAALVLLLVSGVAWAETEPPPAAAAPLTAIAQVPPSAHEHEELVLQLNINGDTMTEFVQGLQKGAQTYLPLGQLCSLLDFPITVNTKNLTASGWFIRENNKFSLTEKKAEVRGDTTVLSADDLIAQDQDIYVNALLLQKWFPMTFSVDFKGMILNIVTSEELPFQETLKRKKLYENMERGQHKDKKETVFKNILHAYDAFQWPSVDLTFSPTYENHGKGYHSPYSLLAAGDEGYLTSKFFAAGDISERSLTDLRMTFGRNDYERKLLGPLKASSFSFGDITSAGLEQATASGQGRGFTVSNRALDRPDKFDITSFIGDSKPGWDVELYRNDVLLSFQTVGTDGRYQFLDVPVLFGNNVFKLVFYGPQGQREETSRTINADSSLLNKGEFSYNFSADQKSRTVAGVADEADGVQPAPRLVGEFEYGLSRWLTGTIGAARTNVNNVNHSYTTAGLHSSFGGILTALDSAYDTTDHGRSSRLSVSANRLGADLRFQHRIAKSFVSETDNSGVIAQTDIGISRGLSLPLLGEFNNNLSLTRKTYEDSRKENIATYNLSKSFLGISLTNTLQYNRDNAGLATTTGVTTVHANLDRKRFEAQISYDLNPQKKFTKTRLASLIPLSKSITDNTVLTNTYGDSPLTELENTVTFDMERYKLSLTGRLDSKQNYFAGLSVNTAIGKVPGTGEWITSSKSLAGSGTIIVRPFIDRNYNQVFDPDEKRPPDLPIRIGGGAPAPNDKGLFIATQVAVDLPVTISLDQDKQNDPFRIDQKANPNLVATAYHVVPRAGKVITIDFPLFETSQLDGVISVPEGGDAGGLQVSAVTLEGQTVGTTRTAYDGYYMMEGLMPGTYLIQVSGDKLGKQRLKQTDNRTLAISASDFYTRDITLETEQETATVTMP